MTTKKLFNKRELAQELGVKIPSLNVLIQEGMPVAVQGKGGVQSQFDLDEVKQWLDTRHEGKEPGLTELKKRKLQIDVALAELELKKERNELIAIAAVAEDVGNMLARVKARLLALPVKTAGLVLGMPTQREIEAELRSQVLVVLKELTSEFAPPDSE